ncbi:MAG: acyl-phosphate glycerol 3-phosphate acyltransferase [Phascolarctobacterium sp.]|nr:MAG: acyl-phosphate glycerol 3-phosphate acyltransferase [Phascolarctobacterium sp.]
MEIITFVLWFAVGFVFGSVPSGLWLVKAIHGIDIRQYGSKNIGSTNVFRTVGGKTAALVLLCDAGKGILAALLADMVTGGDLYAVLFAAIGALLGHNYSLFLGFKGGRGVATGLGLLIFLMPKVSGICFLVWLAIVLATRYVSLGSCVGALCAPFLAFYFGYPLPVIIFAAIAAAFVIIRHKDNIKRLLNGTESKIKQGHAEDLKK